MTDEQINAAIAAHLKVPKMYGIPNFSGDLNAMHEAEKTLNIHGDFNEYYASLFYVTKSKVWPIHATARQRAEAFLRSFGLWKDVFEEVQP